MSYHPSDSNVFQQQPVGMKFCQSLVQLLYFDNLEHLDSSSRSKSQENKVCDEIIFQTLVRVQLIRIVRPGFNVHQNLKRLVTITQSEKPIRNLEIFAKTYRYPPSPMLPSKVTSRYTLLYSGLELHTEGTDILIPLEQPFITDFMVFRGEYKRMTVCIYGDLMTRQMIMSFAPNYGENIDLQDLNNAVEARIRRIRCTLGEEPDLSAYNQTRRSVAEVLDNIFVKENYHLCVDNIQPQLLLDEKAFNQQESQKQIENLAKELNSIDQDYDFVDKQLVSLYHDKLEQLNRVLTKHLRHAKADIHSAAHFNDVDRIYKLLPQTLVYSALFALKASYSSALRAFPLIVNLMSSKFHALLFLDKGGLDVLLDFLQEKQQLPSYFRLKVVETLFHCLNHVEYCNELIRERQVLIDAETNDEPSKKKKKKEKKEKKEKKKKDQKKKKNKKKSRSRSRSQDADPNAAGAQDLAEQSKRYNGFQLIASTQARSDDSKIIQACQATLDRLQIYKRFRKLKEDLDDVYNGRIDYNEQCDSTIKFLIQHFPFQWELENMASIDIFLFTVQKDFYCDKQRELTYCLFDGEKTKTPNFRLVKDIIQMKDRQITYANAMWFKQMQFMKYLAAMMAIKGEEINDCCDLIRMILEVKGGIVVVCQEAAALKLIIQVLSKKKDTYAKQLLNLIKSSLALINLLDQVYIKLLGSDFDYELISHLSQLQRFTEEQDEKQQKGNAVSVLVNNEFFSEALFYIFMLQRNEELYEKEVEITIMSHIFMNILRYNNRPIGLAVADRLIAPNAKYIKAINAEKSRYSTEFRSSQVFLAAMLEPYELFLAKDTTKGIREQFHLRLKFITINQDPDKNKLKEYFGVGEHRKGIHEELKQEFRLLGVYDQPAQNIQFLDGAVKIFRWLIDSNKYYFIPFFENEVIAGVECFANKLTSVFTAMISKNIQAEYMTHKLNNLSKVMRDYFDLTYNTISLVEKRLQFRQQLGCESSFHSTDLCKILIDLWVALAKVLEKSEHYSCFSVFGERSESLYNSRKKALDLREILLSCFEGIITLNSFVDDEQESGKLHVQQGNQEIQSLFQNLYLAAFRSQEDQKFVLNLMQILVQKNGKKPQFAKNVYSVLFKMMRKNDDEFENYTKNGDLGFLIDHMGEQKCLQNLLQSALHTYDKSLKAEAFKLVNNLLLLNDHDITYTFYQLIEDSLKQSLNKFKAMAQSRKEDQKTYLKYRQDWCQVGLFVVQTINIALMNSGFMYIFNYEHLNEDMIKLHKWVDEEIEYCDSVPSDYSYRLLIATLRNEILSVFAKAVDHELGVSLEGSSNQYLIEDIPHITHQQNLLKGLSKLLSKPIIQVKEQQKEYYHLNLIAFRLAIQILDYTSKNIVGQNILLYSDYSQIPYKPKPILPLSIVSEYVLDILAQFGQLNHPKEYQQIVDSFVNMIFRLFIYIPNGVIHSGDVRKRAITQLLFDKKLEKYKPENITELISLLQNTLSTMPAFTQSYKVLVFLAKQLALPNTIEKDQNITLPNEPRHHEKIFQILQERLNDNNSTQNDCLLSNFFKATVLENDKMLKYQSLIISEVTPWRMLFPQLPKPEPTFKAPEILYSEILFKLQPLEIKPYPKTEVNEILTLNSCQLVPQKDRIGLAKHLAVQVIPQPQPQTQPFNDIKPAAPKSTIPPRYCPGNMFPMQQPSITSDTSPIIEVPVIPIRTPNLLEGLAPPPNHMEDPRLRPQQQQPNIMMMVPPPSTMGSMGQMGQMGQMNQLSQLNPMNQMGQMGQMGQMNHLSQMNQMGAMNPMMMMAPPPPIPQSTQQMGHQMAGASMGMMNQGQHSMHHGQQLSMGNQQIMNPSMQQAHMQHQMHQNNLQQPPQQQMMTQQHQQSHQQSHQQQGSQSQEGPAHQNILQSLIASMSDEEKTILRNFLNSTDPNKQDVLERERHRYDKINQFLTELKKQQKGRK